MSGSSPSDRDHAASRGTPFGALGDGAFAVLLALAVGSAAWFGLGMSRGLLLSLDIRDQVPPWHGVAGPTAPPAAPLLSDPVWQFVPWLEFARQEIVQGRLPLWNPHQDGGVPLLGNGQSALLSPEVWPVLAIGVARGWNLSLLLRILLAAVGAFMLARRIGISQFGAALAGVTFALGSPFIAWLEHPQTMVMAAAPWLLLAVDVALEGAGVRALWGVGATTWLVLVGGHPESMGFVAVLAAAWLAVRSRNRRRAGAVVAWAGLGAVAAAPALLPFLEYLSVSGAISGVGRHATLLPWGALIRLVDAHYPAGHPIEGALFVSVPVVALAMIGAIGGRSRSGVRFAIGIVAVVLLLSCEGPVGRAFASHTLWYGTRALPLLSLALGWLAGLGLDVCVARAGRKGRERVGAALAGAILTVVCVRLVAAAEGVHAVTPARLLNETTPILEVLRGEREPFRVLPLHNALPPDSATALGLDDVRGYDALAPDAWRRARRAIGRFGHTASVSDAIEPWDLTPGGAALDEWNVTYLLVPPQTPYPAWRMRRDLHLDVETVYEGPDGTLLRNLRALPRVRVDDGGPVLVVGRSPGHWRLVTDGGSKRTVTVADPFFPGWRATVDGRPAALARVTGEPMRVPVASGRHVVALDYEPLSFRLGCWLAALALCGAIGWSGAVSYRRARHRRWYQK